MTQRRARRLAALLGGIGVMWSFTLPGEADTVIRVEPRKAPLVFAAEEIRRSITKRIPRRPNLSRAA